MKIYKLMWMLLGLSVLPLTGGCYANSTATTSNSPPSASVMAAMPSSFKEFCTIQGGELIQIANQAAICTLEQSACDENQYKQDKCLNLSGCVAQPTDCRKGIPPLAPHFCVSGQVYSKMDACGCHHGTVCDPKAHN